METGANLALAEAAAAFSASTPLQNSMKAVPFNFWVPLSFTSLTPQPHPSAWHYGITPVADSQATVTADKPPQPHPFAAAEPPCFYCSS